MDLTTTLVADRVHFDELRLTWPTWKAFKPEILQHPLLMVADAELRDEDFGWIDHPLFKPGRDVVWGRRGDFHCNHRDRMLSYFVLTLPQLVKTKYYLKIDTDVIATSPGSLTLDWWFEGEPVFVASPWGYTKPADALESLDDWADKVPGLADHPRLAVPYIRGAPMVRHKRMISWLMFGRTDWTRRMATLADGRLPVPSQDTYLWYCAARRDDFHRIVNFAKHGWKHCSPSRLSQECAAICDSLA